MSISTWVRWAYAEYVVYSDGAEDELGLHQHCIIGNTHGLWVKLKRLSVHSPEELNKFRALLVDVWDEAEELFARPRRRSDGVGADLAIDATSRGLVLRSAGTVLASTADLRRTVARLAETRKARWHN